MTRQRYAILESIAGVNPDTNRLLVAQRWSLPITPPRSIVRHAFVIATQGVITTHRAGTPHATQESFDLAAGELGAWVVSEETARGHLEQLGQQRYPQCINPECGEKLPLCGLYCLECGANQLVPLADQPRLVAATA